MPSQFTKEVTKYIPMYDLQVGQLAEIVGNCTGVSGCVVLKTQVRGFICIYNAGGASVGTGWESNCSLTVRPLGPGEFVKLYNEEKNV